MANDKERNPNAATPHPGEGKAADPAKGRGKSGAAHAAHPADADEATEETGHTPENPGPGVARVEGA